jgi:argininosuccinate lyase
VAKLWKGRFRTGTHPLMEAFSESISFDRALAAVDIRASVAHAEMLHGAGLLSASDLSAIRKGLEAIAGDIAAGTFVFRPEDEDIHMAVEAALTDRIGEPARRLHTARSRNDQVATDLRLWTREAIDNLDALLADAQRAFVEVAESNVEIVIPGYTHLQRAQPVLLAQHLLAYVEMLARDRDRLRDARRRVNRLPLGACALAGTTLPVDRDAVRKALGFDALSANSMDATSDRDFVVEILNALALIQVHLSRFAEDAILWASSEWGLLLLDDAWSTGSSIMPQKRNPDLPELLRGKSGRVVGDLVAILTLLKGLPLTYNRDLQEDKPPLFDAVRTVTESLRVTAGFVRAMRFRPERAEALLAEGYLEATVMAEYLVEKGMPFREAHEVVGALVRRAEESGIGLADFPLDALRDESDLFGEEIFARLRPKNVPKAYKSIGSAGPREVKKAIRRWTKRLAT